MEGSRHSLSPSGELPIIDIAALLDTFADAELITATSAEIDAACRQFGFFGVVGHGLGDDRFDRLESASRQFFALPESTKAEIAMSRAGAAWRGWFPVGGELTDGRPDQKEGLYFGSEHGADHPRVTAGTPLHGTNQFPVDPADLGAIVLDWLAALEPVAAAILRGIAVALGLEATWFADRLTADPTILFRIFHYPPAASADDGWGVAEHTDYGLLTLLAQDHLGGLEVQRPDGSWIAVEPVPQMLVCNLGDMLERFSDGRYRSTPHRVRNTSGVGRLSFPYFYDPSWEATVPGLDITYGDYLTAKVSRVFPELFVTAVGPTPRSPTAAHSE